MTFLQIPASEYHARSEASSTQIRTLMSNTPLHYWARHEAPPEKRLPNDPTPAMMLGTVTHTLTLEPLQFDEEFLVMPDIKRNTKVGKAAYAEWLETVTGTQVGELQEPKVNRATNAGRREYEAWLAEHTGRPHIIDADMAQTARAMANAVASDPRFEALMADAHTIEGSAAWEYRASDLIVPARARLDLLTNGGRLVDLKSATDASPRAFATAIGRHRYDVQLAHYGNAVEVVTGEAPTSYTWVVVESKPPHAVAVYNLDEDSIARAAHDLDEAIEALAVCRRDDWWPGYEEQDISTPTWA